MNILVTGGLGLIGHNVVDTVKFVNNNLWLTDTGISRAFGNKPYQYLDISKVAYYSVAIYISTLITVPRRSLFQIANPLSAKLLNEKKFTELNVLYKNKPPPTIFDNSKSSNIILDP
mgnify:CR=1 FL=1